MKKDLIIIPGFYYKRKDFSKLIDYLSQRFKVYFFAPDYTQSMNSVLEELMKFIKLNNLGQINFVTHSYGSVVLDYFYKNNPDKLNKAFEIAPLNKGSRLLKRLDKLFSLFRKINKDHLKFILNREQINLVDRDIFIIAGNKRFDGRHIEYYFLPFIINNRKSDGKVFVEETKIDGVNNFKIIHDSHTGLLSNEMVFEEIKRFYEK